jgi:hypothetical protein
MGQIHIENKKKESGFSVWISPDALLCVFA